MPQDITRRGEVHVESVHFGIVEGDRKLRRKSSKKLVHNSQIVSDIFVADHLVILGGADGESTFFRTIPISRFLSAVILLQVPFF